MGSNEAHLGTISHSAAAFQFQTSPQEEEEEEGIRKKQEMDSGLFFFSTTTSLNPKFFNAQITSPYS
jgi:hypothetical protein